MSTILEAQAIIKAYEKDKKDNEDNGRPEK